MITKESLIRGHCSDFKTPIVVLFFTRSRTLEKVFAMVKKIRPQKLFLIQDGARDDVQDDKKNIQACREIVCNEAIDWDCDVYRNYSETNQGTCYCQFKGFSWVFDHVDRAIILEDDCLPNQSFFKFCDELLEKYLHDSRINMITGYNFHDIMHDVPDSYFFGKSGTNWGWATWARAWKLAEVDLKNIAKDNYSKKLFYDLNVKRVSRRKIHAINTIEKKLKINRWTTWDTQWGLVKDLYFQIAIIPRCNLINNIGVGDDSAHFSAFETLSFDDKKLFRRKQYELQFPLRHPQYIIPNVNYDRYVERIVYANFFRRVLRKADHKIKQIIFSVIHIFHN